MSQPVDTRTACIRMVLSRSNHSGASPAYLLQSASALVTPEVAALANLRLLVLAPELAQEFTPKPLRCVRLAEGLGRACPA